MFFKEDARSVGTADYNTSTKKPTLPITHDGRAPGVHWFIGSLVSLGSTDVGPENSFVLGSTKLLINYFFILYGSDSNFAWPLLRSASNFARTSLGLNGLNGLNDPNGHSNHDATIFFCSIIRPFATLRSAKNKRARAPRPTRRIRRARWSLERTRRTRRRPKATRAPRGPSGPTRRSR